MDEKSRAVLDVLRSDKKLSWVVEQIVGSFSEGIAHSATESAGVFQRELFDTIVLSPRERTKREKYEMSRPYEEDEKLELLRFALEEIFVTLPSMQDISARALKDLGSSASFIEFLPPDEEERTEGSYTRELVKDPKHRADVRQRLDTFLRRLKP